MNDLERKQLRAEVLDRRNGLSPTQRRKKSREITERLLELPEVMQRETFLVYIHFRSEVETLPLVRHLIERKKKVTVPRTLPDAYQLEAVVLTDPDHQLVPGYCGIPEPTGGPGSGELISSSDIDIVIVPGAVFDIRGGRLGYGGGYYDRFLSGAARALRVGLAFEMQVVEQVPVLPHDQLVDIVVTEKQVLDCRRIRHAQDSSVST
ncbi:MAG: 5-formyltetrahydrofolate cyclo-ligase [Desulfobulbaceae bacterium]